MSQNRWEHEPAPNVIVPSAVHDFYRTARLDLGPSLNNPGQSSSLQQLPIAVDFTTAFAMNESDTADLCNFYLDVLPGMHFETGPSTFSSGKPATEPQLPDSSASTVVRNTQASPQQQRPHSALECKHPTRPSALAMQVAKIGSSIDEIDAGAGDANSALEVAYTCLCTIFEVVMIV